jgi:hypothetical protein
MINPELKVGDRVILLTMEGEPNMTYEGGVVVPIDKFNNPYVVVFGHKQYNVKWDNGRTYNLLEDADKWMYEKDFNKKKKKKKIEESYTITKKQLLDNI